MHNLVVSLRFEKLTDRTQIECTRSTRAFARWFEVFFSNMASKNCRKYFFRHFFFIWPKIHIYAKNEVYRSKNEKKALLACTLPLRDLSIESEKKIVLFIMKMVPILQYMKHGSIFTEHGSIFTEHGSIFTEHGSIFTEHGSMFTEHGSIFTEHGSIFTEHGSIFTEHDSIFTEHGLCILSNWQKKWLNCRKKVTKSEKNLHYSDKMVTKSALSGWNLGENGPFLRILAPF